MTLRTERRPLRRRLFWFWKNPLCRNLALFKRAIYSCEHLSNVFHLKFIYVAKRSILCSLPNWQNIKLILCVMGKWSEFVIDGTTKNIPRFRFRNIVLSRLCRIPIQHSNDGTYASVKSLLNRDYVHHVGLSETRKILKG
jgi:hypothetical protein